MDKQIPSKVAKALDSYISEAKRILDLDFWSVDVSTVLLDGDENLATIQTHSEGHEATINFSNGFFRCTHDYQRKVIAHELCHLLVEPIVWYVKDHYHPLVSTQDGFTRTVEFLVDDISRRLALQLPAVPETITSTEN